MKLTFEKVMFTLSMLMMVGYAWYAVASSRWAVLPAASWGFSAGLWFNDLISDRKVVRR